MCSQSAATTPKSLEKTTCRETSPEKIWVSKVFPKNAKQRLGSTSEGFTFHGCPNQPSDVSPQSPLDSSEGSPADPMDAFVGGATGKMNSEWENPMESAARFENVIRWIVALLVRIMMLWKYPLDDSDLHAHREFQLCCFTCSVYQTVMVSSMFLVACTCVCWLLLFCLLVSPNFLLTGSLLLAACSVDHSVAVDAIIQFCPDAG